MKDLTARRRPVAKHKQADGKRVANRKQFAKSRWHFAIAVIGVLIGIAGRIRSIADTRATARRALALAIRANERMDASDQAWELWNRLHPADGFGQVSQAGGPTAGRHLSLLPGGNLPPRGLSSSFGPVWYGLVDTGSRNDSAPGRGTLPASVRETIDRLCPEEEPAADRPEVFDSHTSAQTQAKPRNRRDPDAPFGYGDDGKPVAKYGYRKDGRPRATKPRDRKPASGRGRNSTSAPSMGAASAHPKPELKSAARTHPLRTPAESAPPQNLHPAISAGVQPTARLRRQVRRLRVLVACSFAAAVIAIAGMVATMMIGTAV